MTLRTWFVTVFGLLVLRCGQTPKPVAPRASAPPPSDRRVPAAPAAAVPEAPANCALDTVYFAYDSALLDDRARETVIAAIGCYQRSGVPARLFLRGATDPRGTEDYNLALGHRRAAAVQQLLVTLGIPPDRVSVTSIGEERATGRDEAGFRLDRHVAAVEP